MATKPIPGATGPVAEFARELRKLRDQAGNPPLRAMAAIGFVSVPTLSAVHAGKTFPTWAATRAYIRGCRLTEEEVGAWLGRWLRVADLAEYRGSRPDDPRASTSVIRRVDPPVCEDITSVAQFRARLRELRTWARMSSQAEIVRRAAAAGLRLPRATVSDMLRKDTVHQLPSAGNVRAFLVACGLDEQQAGSWLKVHGNLERRPRRPNSAASGTGGRAVGVATPPAPEWPPRSAVGVAKLPEPGPPQSTSDSTKPSIFQRFRRRLPQIPTTDPPSTTPTNPPGPTPADRPGPALANRPGSSRLAGRYRLVERLGAGGMSVVWRGFDEVLGRQVAVKVLPPSTSGDPVFRRRLRTEAQAAARLSHPNITNVYDYGEASTVDGEPVAYVVMELVDGESLAAVLARRRKLSWPAAVKITADVAAALTGAHSRGVVHRDVTPANVMLTNTGAMVVDFGISALIGENDIDPDGSLLGTPAYLAPERLEGGQVSPATDVYAVGLLVYRMLTGSLPWDVGTTTALLRAHQYTAPEPLPPVDGLPPPVAELIARCLRKRPEDRPSSAEVADVLARTAATAPPATDASAVFGWADDLGENTTILPSVLRWSTEYRGRHRKDPGQD